MDSPRKVGQHLVENEDQYPVEVMHGLESLEIGCSITKSLVDNVDNYIRDQRLNELIKPIATAGAMKEQLFMIGLKCLQADPCLDNDIIEEEQAPIPAPDPRAFK